MKDIIFRPDKEAGELECCQVCNRPVGMTYRDDDFVAPTMCVVCMTRFPMKQWERDEQGVFFNLTKNGVDKWENGKITALMSQNGGSTK